MLILFLVHDKTSEELFVKNEFGLYRKDLMYNHFLLVGPKSLNISFNNENIYQVLQKIYDNKLTFVSRGDNSGTNKKEISLWKNLGLKNKYKKRSLVFGNWFWNGGFFKYSSK